MSEYSVEEVRAHAAILRDWRNGFAPGVGNDDAAGMLDAYASLLERIKAGEGASPIYQRKQDGNWQDLSEDQYNRVCNCALTITRILYPHPPAQAAQVDAEGKAQWDELAAILGCDGDNVDLVLRTAKRLMSDRIAPTAKPAAQGEVDELIAAYDDAVRSERESGFLPPLAQQAARDCVSHNRSRLRKALAAQPRAVPDVAAMVNRFLGWRLPDDFYPDGGISFTHVTNPSWTHDSWPIGTNLFTAAQAGQMFRYVLAVPASQAPIYCCTHCKLPNHDGIDHADCEDAAASRAMLAAAPSPGESK